MCRRNQFSSMESELQLAISAVHVRFPYILERVFRKDFYCCFLFKINKTTHMIAQIGLKEVTTVTDNYFRRTGTCHSFFLLEFKVE